MAKRKVGVTTVMATIDANIAIEEDNNYNDKQSDRSERKGMREGKGERKGEGEGAREGEMKLDKK